MCGKAPKAPPPVVQRDPVAEQAKAEAEAQQNANADAANRRRRRGWSGALSSAAARAGNLGGSSQTGNRSLLAQATAGPLTGPPPVKAM